MPRRGDPARTFIVHERTPTDRDAAINNNAVRSTSAGNAKLGGWSGRAGKRHADSTDANINRAKHTSSTNVFPAITHPNTLAGTHQRNIFSSLTEVAKSTREEHVLNRETWTPCLHFHACTRPAPCATDAAVGGQVLKRNRNTSRVN
jgi:hypothetical protein